MIFLKTIKMAALCRHDVFKSINIIHKKRKKSRENLGSHKKYVVIQAVILQPGIKASV